VSFVLHTFVSKSITMKTVALFALAGSASAFAPAQSVKSSTALNAFANGLVGGEGPEPIPFSSQGTSVNFDPCGFAEVGFFSARLFCLIR
jgi:hypothetical protein